MALPIVTPRSRFMMIALAAAIVALTAGASLAHAAAPAQVASIEALWIDMRIGPPLVKLYNAAAGPEDIARIDRPEQIMQLAGIEGGRKLVVFRSIAELEQFLPQMADEFDIIGYNVEHGEATPLEEQQALVASVQRVRALADQYGLALAVGPDQDYAVSHGVAIAPFVEIFVLQVQRQQTNQALVETYVASIAPALRAANPDLQISVQVRTEGDMGDLLMLLDALKGHLDGVSILTSPDTVGEAEDLVVALRPHVGRSGQLMFFTLLAIPAILLIGGGLLILRRMSRA